MKSIFETLAALSAGAALLSACGGAPSPVNGSEVPAATETKLSSAQTQAPAAPAEHKADGATAGATNAAPPPAATSNAAATPPPASTGAAKAAPAKPAGQKKTAAKKGDANAACGAGTCG